MEDKSILNDIKKLLGLTEDCVDFDTDIIIHINSAFMVLAQLGVGPTEGFSIKDKSSKWSEFKIEEGKLESVKTYIYLKVRIVFDPPINAAVLAAFQESIKELEWRMNVEIENRNIAKEE